MVTIILSFALPYLLCVFRYNPKKLTYEQRKASLVERLNQLNSSTIKPKNPLTCLPLNYIKERLITKLERRNLVYIKVSSKKFSEIQ